MKGKNKNGTLNMKGKIKMNEGKNKNGTLNMKGKKIKWHFEYGRGKK